MRVAIIGAGPAGLCSARHAIDAGHDVTIFEQEADVGGVWLYSDNPKSHSALYDGMTTNMAKQLMEFEHLEFDEETSAFMKSEEVFKYLKKYAKGLPVELNTRVDKVTREGDEWKVVTTHNNNQTTTLFDAVFVCNGHQVEPSHSVDWSKYKGARIHSHDYRRAANYAGQRVAVVGTGLSGVDISLQLANVAMEVIFIGHKVYPNLPEVIKLVRGNVIGSTESSILISDDQEVSNVDMVIDCCGYSFAFPFMDESLIKVEHGGKMVMDLWLLVSHIQYPTSLFFIGLNELSFTQAICDQQVKFALALMSGHAKAPSVEEMKKWETNRLEELAAANQGPADYHKMPNAQFDYMKELAELGKFTPIQNIDMMKKLSDLIDEHRQNDVVNYKRMEVVYTKDDIHVKINND